MINRKLQYAFSQRTLIYMMEAQWQMHNKRIVLDIAKKLSAGPKFFSAFVVGIGEVSCYVNKISRSSVICRYCARRGMHAIIKALVGLRCSYVVRRRFNAEKTGGRRCHRHVQVQANLLICAPQVASACMFR